MIGALAALAPARRPERAAPSLQGRIGTIVASVAEGIVTFDERGKIIWVNPAAEVYFGAAPGSLEGGPVEILFEGIDWAQMAPMVGVDGRPGPVIGEHLKFTGRRGDGSSVPAGIVITEARLDNERIMIAIGQDVSDRDRGRGRPEGKRAALPRHLRQRRRRHRLQRRFDGGRPGIVEVNAAFSRMLGFTAGGYAATTSR